jgi:hypothetical protein
MKYDPHFEEVVTSGSKTIGRITQPGPDGFAVESEVVSHLPMTGTLAEARRLLHEIDQAIKARDEAFVVYVAIYDQHERDVDSGAPGNLSLVEDARHLYEAHERRVAELAGGVAHV